MNPQNSSNAGFAPAAEQSDREDLSIHGPRPSVTRISRRAVLLTAVFGAAMGLVVLVAGLGNSTPAKRPGVQEENSIRPTGPIESLRDLPQDYSFDVRQAARGIGYDAHAVAPATRPSAPSAQDQALADQLRQLAELRRKMLEEQRKEQDQAMDSPLVFAGAHPAATSTAAVVNRGPATMPTIVMVGRSDAPLGGFGMDQSGNLSGPMSPGGMSGNQRPDDKEAFLTTAAAVEPYLSKPLLAPLSKYELKAGSVIPGALVTAINTDLPGEVIGQVTENVYDSATGNYLLIPQGSRLLGKYQSSVGNGQNRALLAWQRLIYPSGQSIVLDGMPGADQSGQAGLADKVDYHADKLVASTALSTAIAYAGNLARNPQSSTGNNGQDVIGDSVAQQANRIGEKIIDKELDVQPTITIRQGWPLRVLVNKDMVLAPYSPATN
jgi:type IV secretory pathway VirB10-like protein